MPPLLVKDYDFSETEEKAIITAKWPNNAIHARNADIFASSCYIKVNCPPYFFELDLPHFIDEHTSTASVGQGAVVFQLMKRDVGLWDSLECDMSRDVLLQRREEAMAQHFQSVEQRKKEMQEAKWAKQREMVQKQLEVEQAERAKLQERKDQERLEAENELYSFSSEKIQVDRVKKGDYDHLEPIPVAIAVEEIAEESSDEDDPQLAKLRQQRTDIQSGTFPPTELTITKPKPILPPPRTSFNIPVEFTSRPFRTAARESQDAKWLAAMQRAKEDRQHSGKQMDETNPLFLRKKGNEFLKSSNYESAINAYTAALELDIANIACYSNRAVCHLKMEHHEACVDDCDAALQLLDNNSSNAAMNTEEPDVHLTIATNERRNKLLVRKGTACLRMGALDQAVDCYGEASRLNPSDSKLYSDYQKLQQQLPEQLCDPQ